MQRTFLKTVSILFILVFVVGCSPISESISEEEARQLVIEKHTNANGRPQIVSVDIQWNAYIIEWENKDNREWGTDKVTKDGKVKMIEAAIE